MAPNPEFDIFFKVIGERVMKLVVVMFLFGLGSSVYVDMAMNDPKRER